MPRFCSFASFRKSPRLGLVVTPCSLATFLRSFRLGLPDILRGGSPEWPPRSVSLCVAQSTAIHQHSKLLAQYNLAQIRAAQVWQRESLRLIEHCCSPLCSTHDDDEDLPGDLEATHGDAGEMVAEVNRDKPVNAMSIHLSGPRRCTPAMDATALW